MAWSAQSLRHLVMTAQLQMHQNALSGICFDACSRRRLHRGRRLGRRGACEARGSGGLGPRAQLHRGFGGPLWGA